MLAFHCSTTLLPAVFTALPATRLPIAAGFLAGGASSSCPLAAGTPAAYSTGVTVSGACVAALPLLHSLLVPVWAAAAKARLVPGMELLVASLGCQA
jgi:hypothetical protein